MSFNLEQLQTLRSLHQELDGVIEKLQIVHTDLETALGRIFVFLNDKINAELLFVETQDENLNNRVFCFGATADDDIKRRTPQLLKIDRQSSFATPGFFWCVQPIEMAESQIGSIGIAFSQEKAPEKQFALALLDCVSELLDQFFFGIHTSRLKHSLIMGIQSALKSHSIVDSIDGAIYVLHKEIPFKRMIILYSDKELTGEEKINYLVYEGSERIFDSSTNPDAQLDRFIEGGDCLSSNIEPIKKIIGSEDLTVSYLLDGLIDEDLIGKVIFVPRQGHSFSIFCREIIQVFTETLRQRLVDFNRERNVLRKFFADDIISRLIAEPGYQKQHLTAREEEIGIIFADISGFTKMSEQILKSPERITALIDKWSSEIIDRVFPLGACLDKLVGDCIILLFGPPFYDLTPAEIVARTLKAAMIIRDYTREFLQQPENEDIQKHPDFARFGVAIGVNFCPAVVGLIGPNEDLTAFSSGMNITARLQGLAKADQILVTENFHRIAADIPDYTFTGPESAPVKNVEKPLVYYRLANV